MKITGVYFSGTGNTKWVANELNDSLTQNGCDSEMISIEDIDVLDLAKKFEKSDVIGFLYPGYGCDMPTIYKEYIARLENIRLKRNTKAFSIVTAAINIADGAMITKPLCEKMGAEFMWGNVIIMPCNFDTPVPGFRIPSDEKIRKQKSKAKFKIKSLVDKIEKGEKSYDGNGFVSVIAGKSQRIGWISSMGKYDVKINEDKCISCGVCVKVCPANNLSIDTKGSPAKVNGNCSVCLRCMNNCPTCAIRMFSSKGISEYKKYKGPDNY